MRKILPKIIEVITSDLLLTHHDIMVVSDASDTSIRAVVLHKFKEGKMKAMVHASRTL